jgi:hypothetical protein
MTEPAAAAVTELLNVDTTPRKFDDLPVFPQRRMSADELAIARELVTLERRRVAAIEATADAATMDAHTRALALAGAAGLAAILAVLLWRMSQE